MPELFSVKLRKVGKYVGFIIPNDKLMELNIKVGDEIKVALLKHRSPKEIKEGLGMAKHFNEPFERDKTTRDL